MDKHDNKINLEEIIDRRHKRLHELNTATVLITSKHKIKDELQGMRNKVIEISTGIENMRKILERIKKQNAYAKELSSLLEVLNKRISHQKENVPPELIQGYQNADKQGRQTSISPVPQSAVNSAHKLIEQNICANKYNENIIEQETMKDCKRTLFNEPEVCPTISFISAEEFNKVPKYMIGRHTLETINSLINDMNNTLITKYSILSLGKAAAQKRGEINLYLQYKKQEFDSKGEKGCLYFFTAEDYYRQTKTKLDKTKLNLITALRHCKRLRECRIKNELRYVIIN